MLRVVAVAAVLVLAACGSKGEDAPMTDAPAMDSTAMKMDSSAAMDSTAMKADTTMKKM